MIYKLIHFDSRETWTVWKDLVKTCLLQTTDLSTKYDVKIGHFNRQLSLVPGWYIKHSWQQVFCKISIDLLYKTKSLVSLVSLVSLKFAGSHSDDPHIFPSSLLKEMANNWDVRSSRTRNFFLDSSPDRRRLPVSPPKNTGSGFWHHGGGYVWFENPAIDDRRGTKNIQLRGKSCKL